MTLGPPDKRLLVLDDDADVSFTICTIAKGAGHDARATTSADEFLHLVADWAPSHLIVDLAMPEVDGVEILKRLADIAFDGVVIVASGLGNRVLEAAGRAAAENGLNVSGVLGKPFTPNRLRELLSDKTHQPPLKAPENRPQEFQVTRQTLTAGLAEQQIGVYYQPKVSCATEKCIGFEALARWHHPDIGIILPDRFIPLAEDTGLIGELTRQVFGQALRWFAESFRGTNTTIALNMSVRVIADAGLSEWLMTQCQELGLDPHQIVLEITESSSMENPIMMLEFLTQFRIKGFSLSIDDFGVGYSSLIQLARLPFSEMKIDKMFIISAPQSEESQKIAAAIVGLARALGLLVTAEGVEDQWTLSFLAEIGCDSAQGYFIARPMSPDDTLSWLANPPVIDGGC
ncbi:EAL domain-containing response regulator [Porticoccus hydrocarbonoclasticus]|uniref:EAL domain-containing response regulator n=1 Tax=Porticoccus hydrocarbonoclasticus TaxID=1073414 RepID=UPI000689BBAA|nr:EAL domain-containing response regulator [Porticoccus hydrocarbonoclasticus]